MSLTAYLDTGAALDPGAPLLTLHGRSLTYRDVQEHSWRVARALERDGIAVGATVAVLSANDPLAFATVFGIARAGAVWAPVNPRNEAEETRELLELFDCRVLFYARAYADLVARVRDRLPLLTVLVCLDGADAAADPSLARWLEGVPTGPYDRAPASDLAMLVGTGGTTGRPKGVMLSARALATMSSIVLERYPFTGRPVYLAMAPLTHAAGVLCFPVMALGGEVVVMPAPDLGEFLRLVAQARVTHTFLPPTLIYLLLGRADLDAADLSSLQCFWYGAAPMSVTRLEEAITRIGPVMAQLFGQTEAPMMISTMSPAQHLRPDGSVAAERLGTAGRPSPGIEVAVMAPDGALLPAGERGEVVVRGPLVMDGYYKDPAATAAASAHGWHHTGDIGVLDADGWLSIVDRAKDMIITGGFNVYSAEVEQALMQHPDVVDCAVVGLPDDVWGERVVAVVQRVPGSAPVPADLAAHVKALLGSVKAPKQVEVWDDLPRSSVGKVVKPDIRVRLLAAHPA